MVVTALVVEALNREGRTASAAVAADSVDVAPFAHGDLVVTPLCSWRARKGVAGQADWSTKNVLATTSTRNGGDGSASGETGVPG
jgi:hypothetical protein